MDRTIGFTGAPPAMQVPRRASARVVRQRRRAHFRDRPPWYCYHRGRVRTPRSRELAMMAVTFACARCARPNHPSTRSARAAACPSGTAQARRRGRPRRPGPLRGPRPGRPRPVPSCATWSPGAGSRRPRSATAGGWSSRCRSTAAGRLPRPRRDRRRGPALIGLVSVCGPANDRDARLLLKLNARAVEGHFAIKTLRGEEYFVVVRTILAESPRPNRRRRPRPRIAQAADGLEDRLSRGRDLY